MIKLRADVIAGIVSTMALCGASGWIWWREPQRLSTSQLTAAVSNDPKNAEAFTELANRIEKTPAAQMLEARISVPNPVKLLIVIKAVLGVVPK